MMGSSGRRRTILSLGASARLVSATYDEAAGESMLAYWSLLSALSVYEWLLEWALCWLPLYYEVKVALLLWLIAGVGARCLGLVRQSSGLGATVHERISSSSAAPSSRDGNNSGSESSSSSTLTKRAGFLSSSSLAGLRDGSTNSSRSNGSVGLGLDGARVLFTSLLHPAMVRLDAFIHTSLAPAAARGLTRAALALPLSPSFLSSLTHPRSLAPLLGAEMGRWDAVLGEAQWAVQQELTRRGLVAAAAINPVPAAGAGSAPSSSSSSELSVYSVGSGGVGSSATGIAGTSAAAAINARRRAATGGFSQPAPALAVANTAPSAAGAVGIVAVQGRGSAAMSAPSAPTRATSSSSAHAAAAAGMMRPVIGGIGNGAGAGGGGGMISGLIGHLAPTNNNSKRAGGPRQPSSLPAARYAPLIEPLDGEAAGSGDDDAEFTAAVDDVMTDQLLREAADRATPQLQTQGQQHNAASDDDDDGDPLLPGGSGALAGGISGSPSSTVNVRRRRPPRPNG